MKRWLIILVCAFLSANTAFSQITITANDMPVHGDSLRYSNISAMTAMAFTADSGADVNWDYTLTPTSQGIDNYKTPGEISPFLAFTMGNPSCYGYKIADSIPGIGLLVPGITISDMHTFFSKITTPACYAAEAFCASIAGIPVGATYTYPDAWYLFPLNYHDNDSTPFELNFGLASMGGMKQKGYRKTRVDGWGTITTPYFTTPVNCIRVRSELIEVDSISMDSLSFGIPRTTVDYKWLVNGEHYPALWISAISIGGFEIVTSARYRDRYRPELNTKVKNLTADKADVFAYPNPCTEGWVRFEIPNDWKSYTIELFDVQGKSVAAYRNKRHLDVSLLPTGNYIARVTSGGSTAYIKIVR